MISLPLRLLAEAGLPGADKRFADEAHLVRRARGDDPEAFGKLVDRFSHRVFRFIHQYTRQAQDAEDLTQQTFLKAYHHLDSFDCERPLINWLLAIARRTALNHLRSTRVWEQVPEDSASPERSPAELSLAQGEAESLWAVARSTVSSREYEALWLRFGEDLSTREAARVLGLTVPHVKILIFRAKAKLRRHTSR